MALRVKEEVTFDLHDYQDAYLECRDHGHTWKVLGKWRDHQGDWNRRLRCLSCTMGRKDRYHLGVVHRSYDPPDGYYFTEKIDRWSFKQEALDRTPTFSSEEDVLAQRARRQRDSVQNVRRQRGTNRSQGSSRRTRQKAASR